jgi:23S rRNA pseudouridine1911/1915/1917 synthase
MTASSLLPTEKTGIITEHPDFYVVDQSALWLTHPVRARVEVPDMLTYMQTATGESILAPPHPLNRATSGAQLLISPFVMSHCV